MTNIGILEPESPGFRRHCSDTESDLCFSLCQKSSVCVCVTCSSTLQVMDYKWHRTPEAAKDYWLMTSTGQSQWPYQPYTPLPRQQGAAFLSQGHLWWSEPGWFSGKCGTTSGVTVYTWEVRDIRLCRDFGQGSEENETWRMSQGILLHFAPWAILKRFKRQLRSENDSTNMNRLHDVTCGTALTLQHQRCPHDHAGKVRMCLTTLSECGNQWVYFH